MIKEIEETKRNFFLAMIDRKALPMIIVPGKCVNMVNKSKIIILYGTLSD